MLRRVARLLTRIAQVLSGGGDLCRGTPCPVRCPCRHLSRPSGRAPLSRFRCLLGRGGTNLAVRGFLSWFREGFAPLTAPRKTTALDGGYERKYPLRTTLITAALLAAFGAAVASPASAAPIAPGAVAAPADIVSTVQMDRMERRMERRHMERRMMRRHMEHRMMHRHMRHRMMRREMMHRM